MKKSIVFLLLGLSLITFVNPVLSESTKIYKTKDIEDYLQMSLVVGNDFLLFNRDLSFSQTKHFRNQINRDNLTKRMVTKELIKDKYNKRFGRNLSKIVLVENDNLRWKMLGTQLAYHLNCPVYFSLSERIKEKTKEMIVMGTGNKLQESNIKSLKKFKTAYHYYRYVTKDKKMQIKLDDDLYGIMGVHFANCKDGFITFDSIEKINGSVVTWVTNSSDLREEKILEFQNSMDFDGDGIYDYPFGILTGINASDLSLYVERIRYFKSHSLKNHKLLSLNTDTVGGKKAKETGKYKIVRLNGKAATTKNLESELKDTTYFHFMAHGSGSGFALVDDSFSVDNVPELPLQITVAESCSTGDIPFTAENSIA